MHYEYLKGRSGSTVRISIYTAIQKRGEKGSFHKVCHCFFICESKECHHYHSGQTYGWLDGIEWRWQLGCLSPWKHQYSKWPPQPVPSPWDRGRCSFDVPSVKGDVLIRISRIRWRAYTSLFHFQRVLPHTHHVEFLAPCNHWSGHVTWFINDFFAI